MSRLPRGWLSLEADSVSVEQLSLIPDDTIQLRWEEFNRRTPFVFNEIIRIAAQAKDRGETRLSMKYCFEVLRRSIPRGGNIVALNNDFSSVCTRQLIQERPDLAGLFHTRRRHV
jgi:hypothetical protein